MAKRVAIVISGAVSLGSYESGVLYEIVSALEAHNGRVPPEDAWLIDVVVGASAGGMTAAVLVQKGLLAGEALRGPESNTLYNVWVNQITLDDLFDTRDSGHQGESALQSLLSSDFVDQVAREALSVETLTGHRHGAFAPQVRLGLAVTNLNGLDYGVPQEDGTSFTYTGHQDQVVFRPSVTGDTQTDWDSVRAAAVASGAFPYMFRPRDLVRRRSEFQDPGLLPWTSEERTFAYTDGGCVQNQPLGMAKKLVNEIDGHVGDEDRLYLFVSADPMASKADPEFRAAQANYGPFSRRYLWGTMWAQAGFQDWIKAQATTTRVRTLDSQGAAMASGVLRGQPTWQALDAITQPLLALQFAASDPGDQDRALDRLRIQYRALWTQVTQGVGTPGAEAWLRFVLVLEGTAGLGEHEAMNIVAFTTEPGTLAGADLFNFLGFFAQAYREHDYACGRRKAQEVLGPWGLQGYTPSPPEGYRNDLKGLRFQALSPSEKKPFYRGLSRRLGQLTGHFRQPWKFLLRPVLGPLVTTLIKHALEDAERKSSGDLR